MKKKNKLLVAIYYTFKYGWAVLLCLALALLPMIIEWCFNWNADYNSFLFSWIGYYILGASIVLSLICQSIYWVWQKVMTEIHGEGYWD